MVRKNRVSTSSGKDYVAGFLFDVTEIKRREVEADEARKQLADVLENARRSTTATTISSSTGSCRNPYQHWKSSGKPGRTLRDASTVAIPSATSAPVHSQVDELYDTDKERWIEGIVARYHLRHFEFERRNPDGRWYQVYDMRTDDGTFIGVRIDITEFGAKRRCATQCAR